MKVNLPEVRVQVGTSLFIPKFIGYQNYSVYFGGTLFETTKIV